MKRFHNHFISGIVGFFSGAIFIFGPSLLEPFGSLMEGLNTIFAQVGTSNPFVIICVLTFITFFFYTIFYSVLFRKQNFKGIVISFGIFYIGVALSIGLWILGVYIAIQSWQPIL